jgi:hypothetical protein
MQKSGDSRPTDSLSMSRGVAVKFAKEPEYR